MAKRVTEITIQFKQPPLLLFKDSHGTGGAGIKSNMISMRIQPDEGIALRFEAKVPGPSMNIAPVDMDFCYSKAFGVSSANGYERLLLDAMLGDGTLFAHRDGVEATWALLTPILQYWAKNPIKDFPNYAAGTWGPSTGDALMELDGRKWRKLWNAGKLRTVALSLAHGWCNVRGARQTGDGRDRFRLHIGFGRRPAEVAAARRRCLRRLLTAAVAARGVARIAISGGTTPKAMFALLADRSAPYFARVPWEKLHLFWVDERCVPPTDEESNYRMTNEAMLSQGAAAGGADASHGGRAGAGGCGGAVRGGDSRGVRAAGRGDAGVRPGAAGHGRRWAHGVAVSAYRRRCIEMGRLVVANHVPQKETWRVTLTVAGDQPRARGGVSD